MKAIERFMRRLEFHLSKVCMYGYEELMNYIDQYIVLLFKGSLVYFFMDQ